MSSPTDYQSAALATHKRGISFVFGDDINGAIFFLHIDRPYIGGREYHQAAAFNHGGAGHADPRCACCDGNISATEQGRIARKTVAVIDGYSGYLTGKLGPGGKGSNIQTGDCAALPRPIGRTR